MKVYTPTPPSTPPPTPMEIDKMYTTPAQRRSISPKDEERRKGLCHLCKEHGHIQHHCSRKTSKQPARAASIQTVPLCYDPASSLRKRNDVQGKGWLDFSLLSLTNGLARADSENNVSGTRTGGSKGEPLTTAAEADTEDTGSDGY